MSSSCSCCPHDDEQSHVGEKPRSKLTRVIIGAVLFAVTLLSEYGVIKLPKWEWQITFALAFAAWLLIGCDVILRSAKNISRGRVFDENFLMTVSTIGAFCIGEFPEAAAVMLFYQIGESLQEAAVGRARASISRLTDLRPDYANLVTANGLSRVEPGSVRIGDRILVKTGERVPLDGVISEGNSALDLSALTGESMPRDVGPGDDVLSGGVNKQGALTVTVTKIAGESTAAKILSLVESNAAKKAGVENLITTFARYYTPAVVTVAVLLAVIPPLISGSADFRNWVYKALVFLVVSCPCALVISIPLTLFGGLGAASRRGILIKGSAYLSALRNTETVVFDKTGTLTKGVCRVGRVLPETPFTRESLLRCAAGAEALSTHPAALAIVREVESVSTGTTKPEEYAGLGIKANVEGKTVLAGNRRLMEREGVSVSGASVSEALPPGTPVYIAVDGSYAGVIIVNDEIKSDAASTVSSLRELGVRDIVMLTGDGRREAEETARETGITTVHAGLLPHEKSDRLDAILKERSPKSTVVFAGDGINDAPSLVMADVGIAMGGVGCDAAIEAADVVLMTDEPSKVAEAIRISRRTSAIVTQNIVLALGVKGVLLVAGAMGMTTIWGAVFGDVGVALIAVLNALRALRGR